MSKLVDKTKGKYREIMKITAVNKATGEVAELPADTPEEIVTAWQVAGEYEKVAKALREQLKKLVPTLVSDNGTSEAYNGYMFRVSNVQRKNYDKAVLRNVVDEDTLDLLLVPDKVAVDNYLKEHLEELGEASTELRQKMVPVGKSYQIIKLEKVTREV